MANSRLTRLKYKALALKYKALALAKFCLSFRKRDWQLSDYPVVIKESEYGAFPTDSPRFKPVPYSAFIVNWGLMMGTGDTEAEAFSALQATFHQVRLERVQKAEPLPRPGTSAPIQLAPVERVEAHPELADDFIRRVLELDWALITDGSSLWDFNAGENNDPLFARIKDIYGIDVSDIQSARLCEIFERIAAENNSWR
jgi:hypothetical protein